MRNTIGLFVLCFFPIAVMAQKGPYVNALFVSSFYKDGNALGGSVSGGIRPNKFVGLGAGLEVLKFKNLKDPYVPVYADLTYFITPQSPLKAFFTLQPGYAIYRYHTSEYIITPGTPYYLNVDVTGGFFVGTGFGVKFPGKTAPVISARYCNYEFKSTATTNTTTLKQSDKIDAFSVSVGIAF